MPERVDINPAIHKRIMDAHYSEDGSLVFLLPFFGQPNNTHTHTQENTISLILSRTPVILAQNISGLKTKQQCC